MNYNKNRKIWKMKNGQTRKTFLNVFLILLYDTLYDTYFNKLWYTIKIIDKDRKYKVQ